MKGGCTMAMTIKTRKVLRVIKIIVGAVAIFFLLPSITSAFRYSTYSSPFTQQRFEDHVTIATISITVAIGMFVWASYDSKKIKEGKHSGKKVITKHS